MSRPPYPSKARPTDSGGERRDAVLRTLLVSDLVGSTRLVEELGDARAFELFRRHDRLARDLMTRHGGLEIDKTDGFLLLFERPIQAVVYALEYHRALAELSDSEGVDLRARIGIHLGEVYVQENSPEDVARGAKPLEVEGLAKPMAARLMALAEGGQTLLTQGAFELGQRAASGTVAGEARWVEHGPYRLQGVARPVTVFEVGRPGAPLHPPRGSDKARPEPRAGDAASRRSRRLWTALLAGTALLAAAGATLLVLWAPAASGFSFDERDWIVLGDFENRTHDPVLGDALDLAFRVGLEQSRYANLLPVSQVRAALERMKRDPEEAVGREIGSEVCLREGAAALVLGRISELGRTYSLSAEIVDPTTQETIHAVSAEAGAREEILDAVQELATEVRARLGEALSTIEEHSLPLQEVTTPDLEALRAYSLALQEAAQARERESIALLEQAIARDPEFALAHAKLGTVHFNAGIDPAEGARHWREALTHADRLLERERLYIEGSLAWSQRDPERMARPWYLMSTLYPDQAVGHNNLGLVYWRYQNRFRDALEAFERATGAKDPWVYASFHHLGYCQLALGDHDEALETFRAGWEMEPNPVHFGFADALVVHRRYDDAAGFLDRNSDRPSPFQRAQERSHRAAMLADQGRLAEALESLDEAIALARKERLRPPEIRSRAGRILVLAALEDRSAAVAELDALIGELEATLPEAPEEDADFETVPQLALLGKTAARLGELRTAERLLGRLEPFVAQSNIRLWIGYWHTLAGEVALARGEPHEAIRHLRTATQSGLLQARDSLARARFAASEAAHAAEDYRWLLDHRGQVFAESIGSSFFGKEAHVVTWALAHLELARVLRSLGETAEAARLYRAFLDHWGTGGADLEPVREARTELAALEPAPRAHGKGPGRNVSPASSAAGGPQARAATAPSRHPSSPSASSTSASLIAAVKQAPSPISAHIR